MSNCPYVFNVPICLLVLIFRSLHSLVKESFARIFIFAIVNGNHWTGYLELVDYSRVHTVIVQGRYFGFPRCSGECQSWTHFAMQTAVGR